MELAIIGLLGLAVLVLGMAIRARYQDDIRGARERVATGSKTVDTPSGPIEYALAGHGPPVLVVHGAGGGFDQGLDIAADLVRHGFRAIAISRFGYLGTPLPRDASVTAQADAYAAVLDALHVRSCPVLAASAGAPSAMQFALSHPGRVTALVLMVPATFSVASEQHGQGTPKRMSRFTRIVIEAVLKSDFFFWLMGRVAPATMTRAVLGTLPALVASASPRDRARAQTVLSHILPVSARRLGLLNDAAVIATLPRFALERIAAPALLISAADDLYQTFPGARYSAEHIPNARFIGYPSGGHMLVGHNEEVTAEVRSFLWSSVTPRAPAREPASV